jgi:mutator protein MutT
MIDSQQLQLTLVFIMEGDSVLLAMKKRGFGEGKWNGVGGKFEPGETVAEAMVRECQEEIYVTPINFTKMAEINFTENHDGKQSTMLVHVFTCTEWTGEPKESEEMRPRWYKLKEIPYKDMWADDEHWLEQVLSGIKLKASFTLDADDKITSKEVAEFTGEF